MKKGIKRATKHVAGNPVDYPNWMKATANLPGRGFHAATHLVLWAKFQKRTKGQPFEYSAIKCASDFGISRGAAAKGLRILERLGLIRITNQRGRPGLVVFQEIPEKWALPREDAGGKHHSAFFERESPKDSAAAFKKDAGGDNE